MTAGGRIILHVGAPKTGSTYIQARLRTNAAALRARGVHVPVLPAFGAMMGNAKLLATALDGEATPSFRRAFPDLDVGALSPELVLSDLMREWRQDEEDVVLSAENFTPDHAGRLKALLPAKASVTVILFVRRQDLWIESYFSQLIKTRDLTCGMDAFVQMLSNASGARIYRPDWLRHYQAWRRHFDRTHLSCYDAVRDTLFDTFMTSAGLERAAALPALGRVKVAMNSIQLAYLTALPAHLPFDAFLQHRAACDEVSGRDNITFHADLLSSAALAEIKARYGTANAELVKLLGQPDLELLVQARTPPSSTTPLEDLRRTEVYRRFRDEVASMVEDRRTTPTEADR